MARSTPPLDPALVERLTMYGPDAPSLSEKTAILDALRQASPDNRPLVDKLLVEHLDAFATRLDKSRAVQGELREILDRLRTTPWHPAVFLRAIDTGLGRRAMVVGSGGERLVGVDLEVDLNTLQSGDDIYLNQDQTVIMAAAGSLRRAVGETGYFDRWLSDDRLIVKWRDDELVVDAVPSLREANLTAGDRLRWNRTVGIAYEKLDHDPGTRYLAGDVPNAHRSMLGGQAENVDALVTALTTTLVDAAKAVAYGLRGRQTVLLVGPNGVGKTLMVRIAAAEISRLSNRNCRVFIVKPAEFEAPYVGEAQSNIRQCFQALHRAAEQGPTLLFLDEVEAIGRVRGHASGYHSDKFLAALLAEIDGFADRGNVAIVAASNRKDLLDPAFLERLSDLEIEVRRPDRDGASEIFAIHLPATLPFADGEASRALLIQRAVGTLYSPNGDNQLATLRFRDGKTRAVAAADLLSGRTIAQICRTACQSAFVRDLRGGEPGLRGTDIDAAVRRTITRLARSLSPSNVRAYLADLPQDVDVVSVDLVDRRRLSSAHDYLTAA